MKKECTNCKQKKDINLFKIIPGKERQKTRYFHCSECSLINKKCTKCLKEKSLDKFDNLKTGKNCKHSNCKKSRSDMRKTQNISRPPKGTKKNCPKCQKELDESMFHSDKTSSTGLQTYWKNCGKEKTENWASTFDGYITRLFKEL